MHFLLSLLAICSFCLLLAVGLVSVLRDLMRRDLRVVSMPLAQELRSDHPLRSDRPDR